jgi:hypothetical protein
VSLSFHLPDYGGYRQGLLSTALGHAAGWAHADGGRGIINGSPTPWRGKDLCFVDFFLQHQGLFRGWFHVGFPPAAHSLDDTGAVTRPINAFVLFGCFFVLS